MRNADATAQQFAHRCNVETLEFLDLPWVLFVDAQGVLRAAAAVNDRQMHSRVAGWARWFRGRR